MTDQELILKVEEAKALTKNMDFEVGENILYIGICEMLGGYLEGKTEISREVYDKVIILVVDVVTYGYKSITLGEKLEDDCRVIDEKINDFKNKYFLAPYGKDIPELCRYLGMCYSYMPVKIWASYEFLDFRRNWDNLLRRNIGFESLRSKYKGIMEGVIEASHKFFEEKGYYDLKRRRQELYERYNSLSEEESKKAVSIYYNGRIVNIVD